MNGKQIKQAAETMEALADSLEAEQAAHAKTAAELKTVQSKLAEATTQKKTAAEAIQNRKVLAKRAAAALLQSGLITTPERAESFAQEITDPDKAVIALHKFAEASAKAPKTASVVEDNTGGHAPLSSDEVWDNHARQHLPQGA